VSTFQKEAGMQVRRVKSENMFCRGERKEELKIKIVSSCRYSQAITDTLIHTHTFLSTFLAVPSLLLY
jgi:hypothetical protein